MTGRAQTWEQSPAIIFISQNYFSTQNFFIPNFFTIFADQTNNPMNQFELKLDNTTYKCSSNSYAQTNQNWSIEAKFHDLSIRMGIPLESKVPMSKVIIFVTAFHETLKRVQKETSSELNFLHQMA